MHKARLPEAHLRLRRMHVHIDFCRGHFKKQQHDRKGSRRQNVAIRLRQRMQDQAVAHLASVDEDVDRSTIQLLQLGLGDEAAHAQKARLRRLVIGLASPRRRLRQARAREVHLRRAGQHVARHVAAKDLEDALGRIPHGRRHQQRLRGRVQLKMLRRMRQRIVRHQRGDVRQLRRLGLEKFLARGHIEEQVADRDGRAHRRTHVLDFRHLAAMNLNSCANGILFRAGVELNARNRCDGRQRFAAEAERGNVQQVVRGTQLAGGMPLKGQHGVVAAHAAAVVHDADQLAAAAFHLNADARCARIDRVLQQLLYHGGGPLYHLARGDLVRHLVGKYANAAHRSILPASPGPVCASNWEQHLHSHHTWRPTLANEPNSSTSAGKAGFSRMYCILLVAILVLALGAFLMFAFTRQPHGKVSGSGTQKGMIATSFGVTA